MWKKKKRKLAPSHSQGTLSGQESNAKEIID